MSKPDKNELSNISTRILKKIFTKPSHPFLENFNLLDESEKCDSKSFEEYSINDEKDEQTGQK